jgi:hypothetical protein
MKIYLKLSGTAILGYDFTAHDDYQTEIDIEGLANIYTLPYGNNEKFVNAKYVEGALVVLTEQERLAHPNYKARKIDELKNKVSSDIAVLDELKAHSLMGKKSMGGELTQDESDFVSSFLLARQAILDQYELDKAQYE